jgi:hypothetical protein
MSSHFGEATSSIKDLERRNSMTRREEIAKATKECKEDYVGLGRHLTSNDIADAFEEGAEWADKTMIEKACKYAEARYDLDYCGNVRDILNYLKSLVEE